MKIIDNVWSVAEQIMSIAPVPTSLHPDLKITQGRHVSVNFSMCKKIAQDKKEVLIGLKNETQKQKQINNFNDPNGVFRELMASSVNYCYWYGKSDIRPCDASSTKMYELLDEAISHHERGFSLRGAMFKKLLIENRFPLCAERCRHIDEVVESDLWYSIKSDESLEKCFSELLKYIPSFAGDVFLKRAFLFFILLYRKYGWFENEISLIPVPADYQVPKMLRYLGCIEYNDELSCKVARSELIASGSLMECEIRAATLIACREIAQESGSRMADVDTFLWTIRKSCSDNFHLTITTDY